MSLADPPLATTLDSDLLRRTDAYWRAANYLSVGQIYRRDNALLERSLTFADVKPRLLGHWGTTQGLNFPYVHLNRLIASRMASTRSTSSTPAMGRQYRGGRGRTVVRLD